MGQQVSVEAALQVFRHRCGELHDENLLLKARVGELEEETSKLRAAQEPPADPYQQGEGASIPAAGGTVGGAFGLGASPAEQ